MVTLLDFVISALVPRTGFCYARNSKTMLNVLMKNNQVKSNSKVSYRIIGPQA